MQEVARAAGVHQTTVSLALRNDPRLPEETRARIRAVAEKLRYRPDPVLSALVSYRLKRGGAAGATMAFLANFNDRDQLKASRAHRQFFECGRQHAEKIGYRLELFCVGTEVSIDGPRVERVLKARGIQGVVLGAIGRQTTRFDMNWADFSAVMIESQQLGLSLHTITDDQTATAREALRQLHTRGYHRVGLAVGVRGEEIFRQAFSAGYLIESLQHPDLAHVPPLLFRGGSPKELAKELVPWLKANRLDAVASNWNEVPDALRAAGIRAPRDIVVVSLDQSPERGSNCGMRQNHCIVGERAIEQLAFLMKSNQRGFTSVPNHTLIGGEWIEGSDVPYKKTTHVRAAKPKFTLTGSRGAGESP